MFSYVFICFHDFWVSKNLSLENRTRNYSITPLDRNVQRESDQKKDFPLDETRLLSIWWKVQKAASLPSGELTFCYGKSPFLWENPLLMAIFNCYVAVHQRVNICVGYQQQAVWAMPCPKSQNVLPTPQPNQAGWMRQQPSAQHHFLTTSPFLLAFSHFWLFGLVLKYASPKSTCQSSTSLYIPVAIWSISGIHPI